MHIFGGRNSNGSICFGGLGCKARAKGFGQSMQRRGFVATVSIPRPLCIMALLKEDI